MDAERNESPPAPRGRRWLLVVVSTMVSLLLSEAILRVAWTNPYADEDTDQMLEVRRAHANRRFPVDRSVIGAEQQLGWYRTDERGYILPSRRFEYPDSTLLFLGGSTTECRAVLEELRFHAIASDELLERGVRVNALNAGLSGGDAHDSLNILQYDAQQGIALPLTWGAPLILDATGGAAILVLVAGVIGVLALAAQWQTLSERDLAELLHWVFPVRRSWTIGWPDLRDTLRGPGPRGASRHAQQEEAIH